MGGTAASGLIDAHARLYRKINRRILLLLVLGLIFVTIDRYNVAFAKLQMQQDIGISEAVYGVGAGIFFIGYMLFEVPSNLLLATIGARKTFSRIMILWGLTCAAMMFVKGGRSFYVLRFLLGVFEAGFFPGAIFYLTLWYPPARRARTMAVLTSAVILSGLINGPLSTWLMTTLAGVAGLKGWQWMFLAEGLPCALLGLVAFVMLVDQPAHAKWLTPDEKALLNAERAPCPPHQPMRQASLRQALKDPRVYAMAFGYVCLICATNTVVYWLPTLLKSAGVTNLIHIGWLSTLPYLAAGAALIVCGYSADRYGERRWHTTLLAFATALALGGAALSTGHLIPALISLTLAKACAVAAYTVFWAMACDYLKSGAAAGSIAFINSIGQFGGFLAPALIGWLKAATGSLQSGLFVIAALVLAGSVAVGCTRFPLSHADR
jgi:sugar phosphate permease